MTSPRRPTYELSEIQRLVREGRYHITIAAEEGADRLNLTRAGIVRQVLRQAPSWTLSIPSSCRASSRGEGESFGHTVEEGAWDFHHVGRRRGG